MKCRLDSFPKYLKLLTPNLYVKPLGSSFWGDFSGALAGSLVSIPQTLALGLIIGSALGGAFGGVGMLVALYGSVLLGLLAAIFGGCPFIVAGPRASSILIFTALIGQLLHSTTLSHLPDSASTAFALACAAVICAGILQFVFGALRLGQLVNYVPFPVMSGFVNGSALLIILSQVCPAMGISEQQSLGAFLQHLDEIKPATLALSLATALSILLLPKFTKRVPPMPMAFLAGTAIYHLLATLGFADALGGTILPPPEHYALHFIGDGAFTLLSGSFGNELFMLILTATLAMSVLTSLDALFATTAVDEITMRRSNTNRQLMAEGFGNAMAGVLGLAPGSGGLVRSKAALKSGMQSAAGSVGIAIITLFVAFALRPAIGYLPHAVMAGLLIALGVDLIDKWTLARLRRIFSRGEKTIAFYSDSIVMIVVVSTALIADLTTAVGIGVFLSILLFVTQMAHNPVRRSYSALALIPRIYGDIARQTSLERFGKNIAILEIEGVLFFGTVSELESKVEALTTDEIVHVVLDMRHLKHVDASGARALERINARLLLLGGMLVVCHIEMERRQLKNRMISEDNRKYSMPRNIWIKLEDFGTVAMIGKNRFLSDADSGVALCEKHLATKAASSHGALELSNPRPPLIRSLNRHMLRRLRSYISKTSHKPGEVFFLQGSDPDGAFFVASGQVNVMIDLPGTERKRKVRSLFNGSIFGEMALIDPQPRSASIIAVEPTICYYMSSQNFYKLKIEQSDIAFALLSTTAMIFAERLRSTTKMLAEMEA